MYTYILATLLSSLISFAADTTKPPESMPAYDSFPTPVYEAMDKKEEVPNKVNKTFLDSAAQTTNDVNRYLRAKRDQLMEAQKQKRAEFEAAAKKELADWRLSNPKENATNFMKEQGKRRKELADKFAVEKKELEMDVNDKRKKFENFMKDTKKEFRARYNSYVESMKMKEDPAKKEFKEIPKGKGTVLAPEKSSN